LKFLSQKAKNIEKFNSEILNLPKSDIWLTLQKKITSTCLFDFKICFVLLLNRAKNKNK
jgi:hypothetical protein